MITLLKSYAGRDSLGRTVNGGEDLTNKFKETFWEKILSFEH